MFPFSDIEYLFSLNVYNVHVSSLNLANPFVYLFVIYFLILVFFIDSRYKQKYKKYLDDEICCTELICFDFNQLCNGLMKADFLFNFRTIYIL